MATESREFFIKGEPNLLLTLHDGFEFKDGKRVLKNEILIQFSNICDGWGRFSTRDPHTIQKINEWSAEHPGKIKTPQEFKEETTPQEIKLANYERQIAELSATNNRLQQQLRKAG